MEPQLGNQRNQANLALEFATPAPSQLSQLSLGLGKQRNQGNLALEFPTTGKTAEIWRARKSGKPAKPGQPRP